MEINIKASKISAFLTGVAVFIPVYIIKHHESFGDTGNYIIYFIFLAYITAIFLFVIGAMYWETFRFIPSDGVQTTVIRCLMWLLGGTTSLVLIETLDLI